MISVPICGYCGEPIGCVGRFSYVSCAGSVYHPECISKLKVKGD